MLGTLKFYFEPVKIITHEQLNSHKHYNWLFLQTDSYIVKHTHNRSAALLAVKAIAHNTRQIFIQLFTTQYNMHEESFQTTSTTRKCKLRTKFYPLHV